MWIRYINENYYLQQKQRDKSGKWFDRTIIKFGKTKPEFKLPFVYRGVAEDLVSSLKDKSVDLILTDPPYGITQNKWDVKPEWNLISKEYNRILKDNGLIVIFGTVPNIIDVYNTFQKLFDFRFEMIWIKGSATAMWVSNYKPLRTHENIYIFSKKNVNLSKTTFNIKIVGKKDKAYTIKRTITTTNQGDWKNVKFTSKSDGIRFPVSVLPIDIKGVGGTNKEYLNVPTQKPEELIEFFIRGLTNPNDVVLDPYLGSGTVAKVASENCRLCVGSEIDIKMYPIIQKRLKTVIKKYDVSWGTNTNIFKNQIKNMMEN